MRCSVLALAALLPAAGTADRVAFTRAPGGALAAQIQPPNTHYLYAPSAIRLDESGPVSAWACGGGEGPFDSLYFAALADSPVAPEPVLVPRQLDAWVDGHHACAPSVVRMAVPSLFNGSQMLRAFYECSPNFYDAATGERFEGFAQVCAAASADGRVWLKSVGGLAFAPADSAPALPVVNASARVRANCMFAFVDGRFVGNFSNNGACADLGLNYGSGHPSAVLHPLTGELWLFYYSSEGAWEDRGVFVVRSNDGVSFGVPLRTNVQNPMEVRAVLDAASGNVSFIGTLGLYFDHYFAYSADGLAWTWAGSGPDEALVLGEAVAGHCACPAQPSIVADAGGVLRVGAHGVLSAAIIADEGFYSKAEGGPAGGCYSAIEDSSRGATWALYAMLGNFSFAP